MSPCGETVQELFNDIELMLGARDKPVLEERGGHLVEIESS